MLYVFLTPSPPISSSMEDTGQTFKCKRRLNSVNPTLNVRFCDVFNLIILGIGVTSILWVSYLYVLNSANFVSYDTNLNLYRKKKNISPTQFIWTCISFFLLGLLFYECSPYIPLMFFIEQNPNFGSIVILKRKFCNTVSRTLTIFLSVYIFSLAITPAASILCLLVTQIQGHLWTKNTPYWLPLFLILLSNDIEMNPGPYYHHNFFNFMTWNLNSLVKDKFQRVRLLEAHNSLFNYDLISICETNLNDSVELPDKLLNEYSFEPANNPSNTRHGGVGLFYKDSLPIKIRRDLAFEESIVVELKFGRKIIFLPFYIAVLLSITTLRNFRTFCQISKIYTQISKLKILSQYFLPATSMPTRSYGGPMAIQTLKGRK